MVLLRSSRPGTVSKATFCMVISRYVHKLFSSMLHFLPRFLSFVGLDLVPYQLFKCFHSSYTQRSYLPLIFLEAFKNILVVDGVGSIVGLICVMSLLVIMLVVSDWTMSWMAFVQYHVVVGGGKCV